MTSRLCAVRFNLCRAKELRQHWRDFTIPDNVRPPKPERRYA